MAARNIMRAAGIVLCGGRSSRMGRPKAWLPFGAELMLPRVVRIVREAAGPVVVVAAPGQDVPPLPPEVRVVRDEVEGKGPLAGLAAGLSALEGEADAVYLSSCDVPLLKPEFVRCVVDTFCSGQFSTIGSIDIAVPYHEGRFHPLAAAYAVTLLPAIESMLAANSLRLVDLCRKGPSLLLEPHMLVEVDPDLRSLRNVNTPEEYEAALRDLEAHRPG